MNHRDIGVLTRDQEVKRLERKITAIYAQAEKDIEEKLRDFEYRYRVKESIHLQELKDGLITQADFDDWKRGQIFQRKQWQAKKQQIAETLYHANVAAMQMVDGAKANVFMANANYLAYNIEQGTGVSFGFGVYDSATVTNLIKNDPELLPKKKVKKPEDIVWNQKLITAQVTQSIIQGEDLGQLVKRIAFVTSQRNKNAMLTQARTAMTGAQNAGRQARLEEAEELGIKVYKEWMCTLDGHTRDAHRELDGQSVPTNKEFQVYGKKIRYPGDPQAHPSLAYNCRCTLVADVKDYPDKPYQRRDNVTGKPIKNMTYRQWEKAKKKGRI